MVDHSIRETTEDAATPTREPYRVLLVDDQYIIYEAMRRKLASALDIELHYCKEGVKAVQMAGEIGADVILQDLVMPDADGLMLVRYYRANPATANIPIVVLSSREEPKTKEEAFNCGANDYLVKLPDQIEMLARLRYHARAHAAILERNAAVEELKRISLTDGLTRIYNRRHFDQTLASEFRRSRRDQLTLSLILLDVDCFKQFNDHYGHQAGDDCLIQVAGVLRSVVQRPADVVARYGGEEFVVILPETSCEGALAVAEDIRQAVAGLNIPHVKSTVADCVTVSLGVASLVPAPYAKDAQADALIKAADENLYRAKQSGRNRACGPQAGS